MWGLIRKDLLRRWRSPLSTLVMIVFPLFMSAAMGNIFSGGSGKEGFPRITVLVQNLDKNGFIANTLMGALGQSEAQEYLDVVVVDDEGQEMMEAGKASALVVLPADFTENILAGQATEIVVIRNPAEGIKPEIIAQGVGVVTTYLDQGARLLSEDLSIIDGLIKADRMPDAVKMGALASNITTHIEGVGQYLFPPLVKIGSVKEIDEEESGGSKGIFGYILIMTSVMAMLFVATRSVSDIHEERNSGMLRRQLATPLDIGLVVGAKTVFGVVFGIIVLMILAIIGLTVGWIYLPIDPVGAIVLGASFSLSACGFLALVTSLTRTEKQAGLLSWLIVMGMSAIGGSMIPVNQMPAPMQAAAPFTINYWAIDGFTRLVVSGESLADILRHIGTLLAIGVVTSGLAHLVLVRRFRELSS